MRDEPKLEEALPIRPTLSRMCGKLRDRDFHFDSSIERFSRTFVQDAEILNQQKQISIFDFIQDQNVARSKTHPNGLLPLRT